MSSSANLNYLYVYLWVESSSAHQTGYLHPNGQYKLQFSVQNSSTEDTGLRAYTHAQVRIVVRDWCKDIIKFYTDGTYSTLRQNNRYDTPAYTYLPWGGNMSKYRIFSVYFKVHSSTMVWGLQKFFDVGIYASQETIYKKWKKLYPTYSPQT